MQIPALARCILIFSLSFIVSASRAQMAGTYTIDPAQPAAGTNFHTFNEAITALKAGITGAVTINVAPGSGPYNERLHFDHTIKTTASHPLIFKCNGVTLTFLSKEGDQRAGIMIDSADYITIDSLEIIPQGINVDEYGWGVHLLHDADHNTITRCKIINQHNAGLEIQRNDNIIINGTTGWGTDDGNSACDSNIISYNTLIGGYCGITLSSNGDGASMIYGNQIINNTITDFENAGVLLNGNAAGTLIDGNDITQPNAIFARGVVMFMKNESTMISNNRIHNIHNIYGLPISAIFVCSEASAGKETVIANNLIYDLETDDEQNGIEIRYGSPASYVKILHNTIVLDNGNTSNMYATFGINIGFNSNNIQIFNNIIQVTRATASENYGLHVESYTPGLESDHNNWYVASSTAMVNAIANLEGLQMLTLADWQGATGFDLNSTEVNPLLTDLSTGDLKPLEGSIDNKGMNVGIDKDVTGQTRNSSAPDMGAYEFDGPACSVPVAGIAKGLPATTTCEGQPVILTLTGNNSGVGQTYQWQSDVSDQGSFSTVVNAAQAAPAYEIRPVNTLYYRAAVTCGSTTVYSEPVQIFINPALPEGTYTIDPAQPAGGTNFQSMQDAVSAMHCGIRGHVVFNMAPGTYNERVTIPPIPGASASKTITFNGRGATINFAPFFSEESAVIKLDGADFITIDSFNIEIPSANDDEFGFGVQLTNNADHNTVKNCNITLNKTSTGFYYAGVVMSATADNPANVIDASYCDSNTIHNNTISGGYYGITNTSSEIEGLSVGNKITNNIIKDNYAFGVYVANAKDAVIEGNEISRAERTNSYVEYSAIFLSSRNTDAKVTSNRIHDLSTGDPNSTAQLVGINFLYSSSTADAPQVVSNNLLHHLNGKGMQQAFLYNSSSHVQFFHNTLCLEDSAVSSSEPTRGLAVFGATTTGLVFKNNNVSINRLGSGAKHCMFIAPAATTYVSDNNNFYLAASANANVGYRGGSSYATLGDWKTATGREGLSLDVNPVYKAPAQNDFSPTAPAFDNKGAWAGIPKDIIDKDRKTTAPDIGAYEFSVCSSFPVVTVTVDSQAVCTDGPATFNVKDPQTGLTYAWYNDPSGTNAFFTGTSYTVNKLTSPVEYWIEAVTAQGCISLTRTRVKAVPLPPLAQQLDLVVDTATANSVRFTWNAVPGATGYEVSRDGVSFSAPSSGATGLTHEIGGLKAKDTVSIIVRAVASVPCQQITSERVLGQTLNSPFYIPNTFTPNGNGQNDDFRVYSNVIRSLHLMVFNQWGEKVFETTNPNSGWDGTYKGKPQPVAVYVYVARMVFNDGSSANQKGTINLVR